MIKRSANWACLAVALAAVGFFVIPTLARDDNGGGREIPAAFAPFEYLVGRWEGQAMPRDNPAQKFRGWKEVHTWAWAFAGGKVAGLNLTIEGGKNLASGRLTYDSGRKLFVFDAVEPGAPGTKLTFEGSLDRAGKSLVLDHTPSTSGKKGKSPGALRVTLWPNANFIRYTMAHDLKEPGSIQFTRLVEVGVTKDGESLAGATSIAERPKCVVTGGAATMTVSYQGRTFPLCCTGCRDEFNDNPEKYVKKAAQMAAAQTTKSKNGTASPKGVSRFEDAFAGDVADALARAPGAAKGGTSTAKPSAKMDGADTSPPADSKAAAAKKLESSAETAATATAAATKQATRATTLLKLGQNLERSGNTTAALGYYRQVVKDFAKTAAAKTAAERIKAIEPK